MDKSQEKEEPEVFMRDTYLFGWQEGSSFLSRLFKWNTGHFTKEDWQNTKGEVFSKNSSNHNWRLLIG